ncbi:MAG: CIA30 family protein [Gammaproteobacteria bacterium]|nr:CIA30 family protein [Gammaproteobacteria bacterium]
MTISVGGFIKAILLVSSFAAASKSGSEQAEFLRVNPMADVVTLHFSDYQHFERIMLVHDTVMGGRSSGAVIRQSDNAVLFSGNLSLDNNGGFASAEFKLVRPINSINSTALRLNAVADSRTYQLRLKTPSIPQGIAYVAEFTTQPSVQSYLFSLDMFSGRYRGNPIVNLPPLSFADVTHISIMLADKTAGPFHIALYSLSYTSLPE